jgi:hypothetical protein
MDFNLDELGFKDNTEKAIFFLFIVNSCGQRLSVMNFTGNGNPEKVIKKFPKFNGKEYYYYTDFNYDDFEWIGYKKVEFYNERNLNDYYTVLLNHLDILLENKFNDEALNLFSSSILSKPEYYKYSSSKSTLEKLYDKWK